MNPLAYIVTLPPETQIGVAGLVGLLVLLGFNWIGTQVPWTVPFLSKYKEEIAAALSGLAIGWLSNILPGGQWAGASIAGVNFVIALVAGFLSYGVLHFVRNLKAKQAIK